MSKSNTVWGIPPIEPAVRGDELHGWRIDLDDDAWSAADPLRHLAQDEAARAMRFHFERDRRRFVAGRAALRRILATYARTQPAALRLAYGEQGKPRLHTTPGDPQLGFNLSHSRGLAVCCVSPGREVGVDVERIRPRVAIDRIAERFFSPSERECLESLDCGLRREAFFRCWTRKEAYLKAIGRGVFGGSTRFDVTLAPGDPPRLLQVHDAPTEAARWTMHDLSPGRGYVGAVVVEGSPVTLRHWQFDPAV